MFPWTLTGIWCCREQWWKLLDSSVWLCWVFPFYPLAGRNCTLCISYGISLLCLHHETVPWFSLFLFKKKSTNLSGRSDRELVSGIGFASFGFVSDLRILYRFVALFSVSFNLLSICIFLEWCRCYSYIVLICLYSIRSSCCLDLIHLLSANLLWVLSLCASWSNHGSWSFLISS